MTLEYPPKMGTKPPNPFQKSEICGKVQKRAVPGSEASVLFSTSTTSKRIHCEMLRPGAYMKSVPGGTAFTVDGGETVTGPETGRIA